jgi:hypothetical protein
MRLLGLSAAMAAAVVVARRLQARRADAELWRQATRPSGG